MTARSPVSLGRTCSRRNISCDTAFLALCDATPVAYAECHVLNIVVAGLRTAGPQLSAHHVRLIGLTRIFGLSHRWVWDPAVAAADLSRIGSVRLWQHRHRLSWEANLSFRESALWPVPPGAELRIPQAPLVSVGSVWLRDARGWQRSRAEPLVRLVGILVRIRSVRPPAATE